MGFRRARVTHHEASNALGAVVSPIKMLTLTRTCPILGGQLRSLFLLGLKT